MSTPQHKQACALPWLSWLAYLIVATTPGLAQILAQQDFERGVGFGEFGVASYITFGDSSPTLEYELTSTGGTQSNAMAFTVDSSRLVQRWRAELHWVPSLSGSSEYAPDRTYVEFKARVSEVRAFYVDVIFQGGDGGRGLRMDLLPSNTNAFQVYSIPLSSFAVLDTHGVPPVAPIGLSFGIRGDPTDPGSSWGFDGGNVLVVDDLAYRVEPGPRLQISQTRDAGVRLSWRTNFNDHGLEFATNALGLNWFAVTNTVSVEEEAFALTVQATDVQRIYRLRKQ